MNNDYYDALHRIATYLAEDHNEATYILNCFFNQDVIYICIELLCRYIYMQVQVILLIGLKF